MFELRRHDVTLSILLNITRVENYTLRYYLRIKTAEATAVNCRGLGPRQYQFCIMSWKEEGGDEKAGDRE